MNKDEFILQIRRLERFFDTKLSQGRFSYLWEQFHKIHVVTFSKVIDQVIETQRTLPTPRIFKDFLRDVNRSKGKGTLEEKKYQALKTRGLDKPCPSCGDVGIVQEGRFSEKRNKSYSFAYRCPNPECIAVEFEPKYIPKFNRSFHMRDFD